MRIRKGDTSYKCSAIKTNDFRNTRIIQFSILEPVPPVDVAKLFENDTFYFYDDVLNGRFVETINTKLVGLSIKYNEDSTIDIRIKLTKGVVDNEGQICKRCC